MGKSKSKRVLSKTLVPASKRAKRARLDLATVARFNDRGELVIGDARFGRALHERLKDLLLAARGGASAEIIIVTPPPPIPPPIGNSMCGCVARLGDLRVPAEPARGLPTTRPSDRPF